MEKPSVTIRYTFVLWICLIALAVCLATGIPAIVNAPSGERSTLSLVVVCLSFFCLVGIGSGLQKEILDETGVRTELLFWSWGCPWSEVLEVSIVKIPSNRAMGDIPWIYITVPGGTPYHTAKMRWRAKNMLTGYMLGYRKDILACIHFYYGQPDIDEWGKPPTR